MPSLVNAVERQNTVRETRGSAVTFFEKMRIKSEGRGDGANPVQPKVRLEATVRSEDDGPASRGLTADPVSAMFGWRFAEPPIGSRIACRRSL